VIAVNIVRVVCFLVLSLSLDFSWADKVLPQAEAPQRIAAWKKLIRENKTSDQPVVTLKLVNDFFNQLAYIPETAGQGEVDIWQTPLEFLTAGGGDCEDYAIAKYFTLVAMGIPEEKLRITYVVIKDTNHPHMVLTYYAEPSAVPLILDNIQKDLLPASKRGDLAPVYSFNAKDVWIVDRIGKARPYSKANSLSKWQRLLQRLQLEGGNK
jgi:predicted transglutaminase-like cysteine proteinase